MIFGIGTDIVEVGRIEKALAKEQGFKEKVFTQAEMAYCSARAKPFESYAARFAAKEAFLKALGTGWAGEMEFHEIEIVIGISGGPSIVLHGCTERYAEKQGIDAIFVSLSHTSIFATAMVVLEKFGSSLPPRTNFTRTR